MTPSSILRDPHAVRKILVCQLRQIGDVLLATPSIELLARAFPAAAIHVLTEAKCAPMLENNPRVAALHLVDKKNYRHFLDELAFSWKVARQGFDLVVDFQQLPRIRWVVAFSRAPVRLSHTPPWYLKRLGLYTHTVDPLDGYAAMTKASILRPLGIHWNGERPRLYLSAAERAWARNYLDSKGITPGTRLITLDPTHRRTTRRWPAVHWGTLVRKLLQDSGPDADRLRFLILYGPGEAEDGLAVKNAAVLPASQADVCDERVVLPEEVLTLRQVAAVIETAALHVGNCSAPRHIAVAVDTPSLTTQGATSMAWVFPAPEHMGLAAHLPCQPCNENRCADLVGTTPRCLAELTPEDVFAGVRTLLAATDSEGRGA